MLLCATMGVALYNTLIYIAAHSTAAVNIALLNETTPLFIMLLAVIFLKEKFSRWTVFGISMTVIGVAFLLCRGSANNLTSLQFHLGDLWVLGAALIFGIYSLQLKRRPIELKLMTFTLVTFILGWLMLLPIFVWETVTSNAITYTPKMILEIVYLGVMASIIAFLAWAKAVQIIGPSRAALIYYMIPVYSGTLGSIFLNEPLTYVHIVSFFLIICGIYLANRFQIRFIKMKSNIVDI